MEIDLERAGGLAGGERGLRQGLFAEREMFDRFALAGPIITSLRAVKDADEQDAMQRAAEATDALLPAIYAACREGTTEAGVAQVIHDGIAEGGHEAIGITLWAWGQDLRTSVGFFAPGVQDVIVNTVTDLIRE